jgi:hypothetical protein
MTKKKTPPPKAADVVATRDANFAPSQDVWQRMGEIVMVARKAGTLRQGLTDEQAMLILQKGWEVGLTPIQALETIYFAWNAEQGRSQLVIDTAGQKSLILQKRLGYIEPIEWDAAHAVVKAVRQDSFGRREQTFRYDLDRAERDGLLMRRSWASGANREGLFIARATGMAVRAMFEDAVGGLGYTAEEIESSGAGGNGSPGAGAAPPSIPPTTHAAGGGTSDVATLPPVVPIIFPDPPAEPRDRPLTFAAGYTNETQPRPLHTHGVTMETLQSILRCSKEQGGLPNWREGQMAVEEGLRQLGIDPRVKGAILHLTEEEGRALRAVVRQRIGLQGTDVPPQSPPAPPAAPPATNGPAEPPPVALRGPDEAWRAAYATFRTAIEQANALEHAHTLEELVCAVSKRKTIEEVPAPILLEAAGEIPVYVKSPQVLEMVLARAKIGLPA